MKNNAKRNLRLALAFELGLGILGIAVAWLADLPIWGKLQLGQLAMLQGFAATLPMLVLLVVVTRSGWQPLVELRRQVDALTEALFSQCTLWDLAAVSLAAGVGEEVLFRGALQSLAEGWMQPVAALAVVSLLFGLVHALSVTYFVLATLVGFYLGWLALATGSLIPPIIAHGLYDFFALWYLRKSNRSQ